MSRPLCWSVFILVLCFGVDASARDARSLVRTGRPLAAKPTESYQGAELAIDARLMRSIVAVRDASITVTLPVDGRDVTLDLRRDHTVGASTRIVRMTSYGPVRYDPRNVVTYRGTLPDDPMSVVSVTLTDREMVADVHTRGRRTMIGMDRRDDLRHVVVNTDAAATTSSLPCRTADDAVSEHVLSMIREASAKPLDRAQATDTLEMSVAIEADHLLYTSLQKDISRATAYLSNLYSICSQIYERDLQTKLTVSFLRVWETADDPYDDEVSVFELIDPFKQYYNANMDSVQRDIAVFMTLRGGQGGIAGSIGGLCLEEGSFAACDATGSSSPLPTWSWDVNLVTHEIGHVCGGLHTQSCLWPGGPLDSCVNSESGDCVPYDKTVPRIGTIMSYCHQTSGQGGGVELVFHPRHKVTLRSFIERSACIGNRTVPQRNVLTGRVIDIDTKQPITGARLTIGAYLDGEGVVMGMPMPSGDTVATTDGQGRYRFEGLGNGILTIRLPGTLTPVPLDFTSLENGVVVMVSDTLTSFDIQVARAQQATVNITADTVPEYMTLAVVSDRLPQFVSQVTIPGFLIQAGIPITRSLPSGRWVVVPMATGVKFQPETLVVDVPADRAADPVGLRLTAARPTSTYQAAAVTLFEREDGTVQFAPFESVVLQNFDGSPAHDLTSSQNGVAFKDDLPDTTAFLMRPEWDTTMYADAENNTAYVAGDYPSVPTFRKRMRRFPLTVRPYAFQVLNGTWTPVSNGTEVMRAPTSRPSRIALPFQFQMGDRVYDSLWVYPYGIASVGRTPMESTYPDLSMPERADALIAPLTGGLRLRGGVGFSGVRTEVRGTVPRRVIVIEWLNLATMLFDPGSGTMRLGGRIDVQLHIQESTGIIDFVYGPVSFERESDVLRASVGLRGNDNLDLQQVSASDLANPSWQNVQASITTDGIGLLLSNDQKPAEGLTYRFLNPATSVAETSASVIDVVPNPTSTQVRVSWSSAHAIDEVVVVDAMGRVVRTVRPTTTSVSVDVSSMAVGSYRILIREGDRMHTHPLIVVR